MPQIAQQDYIRIPLPENPESDATFCRTITDAVKRGVINDVLLVETVSKESNQIYEYRILQSSTITIDEEITIAYVSYLGEIVTLIINTAA